MKDYKILIENRIEQLEKEKARLFSLIGTYEGKLNEDLVNTMSEHDNVLRELKYLLFC